MKNKFIIAPLICLCAIIASCGQTSNNVSDIDSPSINGGLEGNEAEDNFTLENSTSVVDILTKASKITKYKYEVNINLLGTTESFVQYFTPNAWYLEYGNENDFGYAQTLNEKYLFKYYIDEEAQQVYPSIYEYGGYESNSIISGLYTPLTIASASLLTYSISDFDEEDYKYLGANKFIILDSNLMSVFQFMTTYGSSIADYINSFYIQIIDEKSNIFETILDLGSYGTITGKFTPLNETKIDFVNQAVLDGLEGVLENSSIKEAMSLLDNNNFTIHGIKMIEANGYEHEPPATIYCTNDYFVYDYNNVNYKNFGYAFIKANTIVPLYDVDENGNLLGTYKNTMYRYDGCYFFQIENDGQIYFTRFNGPIENESTKYIYVDELPEVGEEGYLYICENEEGKLVVYEYIKTNDVYEWKIYSDWYDSVGDFYVFNYGATFYPSSTVLTSLSSSLFEKIDYKDSYETNFYSLNSDITSALASGLFGWGFQTSTTWMNYITKAYLNINYSSNNEIDSIDFGLGVTATVNGTYGEQKIFYNYSNFGETKFESVETLINSFQKGE